MSAHKFTPGPWRVESEGDFVETDSQVICQFWDKCEDDFPNKEANAHLIAAAPELLAALKGLLKFVPVCEHGTTHRAGAIWTICDDCNGSWADDEGGVPEYKEPSELSAALAAIAKAEGK